MADASTATAPRQPGFGHVKADRARASVAGVFWNFLNIGLSTLLAMGVFLVTSRLLSPADFGAVALAVAIVTMAGTLVPAAFSEALVQRGDLRSDHLDAVFWSAVIVAAALLAALAFAAPAIAGWSDTAILAQILPVLALRLILDAASAVPSSLISRRMQFRTTALRTTAGNVAGALACLWLVFQGYAIWALVLSQIVNSAVAAVITAYGARWRPGLTLRPRALADLRRFGLYAMGGRVLTEARIDQFLLGIVLGAPALGLYFFARRLFTMLKDLTAGVFSPVTNVLMASLQDEGDKRRLAFLTASYASAAFAFPVFTGLIVVAPTAVPLIFGDQWTEAVFALRAFCIVGLMASIGIIQAALIRYLGRPDWWFWYQTAMQLSTVPIILLLWPLGLDAIMAGIVLRTLAMWPVSVRMTQRMLAMPFATYLGSLRGPILGAVALAMASGAVPLALPGAGPAAILAAQVAAGALAYASVLAATSHARLAEIMALLRKRGRTA
ncbi:oligosaccharide flippase family protein [Rhodobacterales bacterium HKCCE2091]|nr:oligosaccharide flippase family protein [Rhodobacterales bacterium HKCCE2091]